jgi:hypothetical protein
MSLTWLYEIDTHPLLTDKWRGLPSDDTRDAQHILAELLLDLRPPAYTGVSAEELSYAVASQVIFQLEHGITPEVIRSVSNAHPGNTTTYRDRYVSPVAWAIVRRVTGMTTVGMTPPGIGV